MVVVADLRTAAEAADRRTAAERNILIYLEVNRGREVGWELKDLGGCECRVVVVGRRGINCKGRSRIVVDGVLDGGGALLQQNARVDDDKFLARESESRQCWAGEAWATSGYVSNWVGAVGTR